MYADLDSGETGLAQVSSGAANQLLPPGSRAMVSFDPEPVLVIAD